MAKESDMASIRVPKSVKDGLKKIALEKEPYHATIQRLIRENADLRIANNMLQNNIEMMEKEKAMQNFTNKLNACDKDTQMAYMVMWKIASDLVPSESERVNALINNDFLTGLINEDKQEKIFVACELTKEQIKFGHEDFYNQLDIVDEYWKYVENQ